MPISIAGLEELQMECRRRLLASRLPTGWWEGRLSSSALSTATALFTLSAWDRKSGNSRTHLELIQNGLRWLAETQNSDGGWGDTIYSLSNISTTALVWAAFGVPEGKVFETTSLRAAEWLQNSAGSLEPKVLARAITARYGKDRTFSVPILTMLAMAGRLGDDGWRFVPQLPFELAACPFQWFQWLQLPVVSYALPALIAIGHVRHRHRPTWNPLTRIVRWLTHARTLRTLRNIQPTTGGYLEATPLTSFVAMSLISADAIQSPVVTEALRFLRASVREDGSWPIDTHLATWVTTLAVNALIPDVDGVASDLSTSDREGIRGWLLDQQYTVTHPYTHAKPGGWAWTPLSGGVPDADDTPGALLALARLGPADARTTKAASAGLCWLLDLQNADGGIPTFCRGWTGLPFDRSSADLSAHTLLAWAAWRERVEPELAGRLDRASELAVNYLKRTQHADGSWAPLWFGNQHSPEVANLTYGTSRVLRLAELGDRFGTPWLECLRRGQRWLIDTQNADGGWGGCAGTPSSIEETALALEGLASFGTCEPAMTLAVNWLRRQVSPDIRLQPSPIGFYFANLWYFEDLYPLIYLVAATSRLSRIE